MRHVNMQASANTAVVLEPSKPHLTDALCIKGYAPTYGHTLATSMDASNREAKEDVKENNFSWFRRLKHRDEREPSSRDIVTEAVQTISLTERKFTSFDRSEAGSKSAKVVDHPSDTVRSTHFDTLPDSSSTARRQKVVEEDKKYGEDEGHKFEIANGAALNNESVWNSTSASPSFAGFGPWVNVRFNRKQEMDPAATLPAAKTVLTTATSSQMVIKEVREDSSSALSGLLKCSVGSSEAEAAVPPMVLRESVSRMHNKIGLPPRPPSQKNSAFSSPCMNLAPGPTACKGISYPQTVEYQLKEQASPLSAFKALDMHVVQTGKLDDEERPSKIGSSHQRLNAMEGRITASMAPSSGSSEYRAQVLVHTPIRVDKSSISSKEQLWTDANERGVSTGSVYSITRVFDEETRETFSRNKQLHSPYTECSDPSLLNSVRENSRSCLETVSMQKPFEYMLSSLNPSHTIKIESSNTSSTNASMMQALDPERARSTLHMPQGGSGHQRILNADEQSAETSISGALPWDFFVKYSEKSADSAREQFIEAHNRARDELVNQRLHKTSTRVSDGELDGIPKLTLGSSFTISDVRDKRLSTREEQQCSEHMQIQNNNAVMGFKNSNFKSVKAQKDARTSMESDQEAG
ncbi:hypothetical protein KP509_39G027400 [Ceratopteris richardii]|uniref:Uncharacterized protein n=1 Tax=Ceratopteris richardii TaxID=49495 RepID=A0A8T2PZ57_CERRI|nr:hypothetical protein KP509_39G027400 [Ceratopteris richardii]